MLAFNFKFFAICELWSINGSYPFINLAKGLKTSLIASEYTGWLGTLTLSYLSCPYLKNKAL